MSLGEHFPDALDMNNSSGENSENDWTNVEGLNQNKISLYCSSLKGDNAVGKTIRCNVCSKDLYVHQTCRGMIDHVTSIHFGLPIYQCRVCSMSFACYISVSVHLRRVHGRSAADGYDDRSDQYEAEIIEWIRKCYEQPRGAQSNGTNFAEKDDAEDRSDQDQVIEKTVVNGEKIANRNGQSKLFEYCSSIRLENNASNKIRCNLCSKDIYFLPKNKNRYMIDHVTSIHFRHKIYRCRFCSEGLTSYRGVDYHIRRMHSRSVKNGYDDNTDRYEDHIIAWIKKCYESGEKNLHDEVANPKQASKTMELMKSSSGCGDREYFEADGDQPSTSTGIMRPSSAEWRPNEYKCDKCSFVTENAVSLVFHIDYHIDIDAYRLHQVK